MPCLPRACSVLVTAQRCHQCPLAPASRLEYVTNRVLQGSGLLERITTAWADTTAPLVREGAMLAFIALCNDVGPPAEPFLLPLLPTLLTHYADKVCLNPAVCILTPVADCAGIGVLHDDITALGIMPPLRASHSMC